MFDSVHVSAHIVILNIVGTYKGQRGECKPHKSRIIKAPVFEQNILIGIFYGASRENQEREGLGWC